ncbi:MAG: ethanolamine ammonia-lyase, partial [Cetobacterium sp.]
MISEKELKNIISQVLKEMDGEVKNIDRVKEKVVGSIEKLEDVEDITKVDLREVIELKNPINREELLKYKRKTPARVG